MPQRDKHASLDVFFMSQTSIHLQTMDGASENTASEALGLVREAHDQVYRNVDEAQHHRNSHASPRQCVCDVCGKVFRSERDLTRHSRTHTGEKPFVCTVCNKGFSDKCHLKTHSMIHTGEKPHVCDVCGEAFIQKCQLHRHWRKHAGDKPFTCEVCGKAFTCASSLSNHKKVHPHRHSHKESNPSSDSGVVYTGIISDYQGHSGGSRDGSEPDDIRRMRVAYSKEHCSSTVSSMGSEDQPELDSEAVGDNDDDDDGGGDDEDEIPLPSLDVKSEEESSPAPAEAAEPGKKAVLWTSIHPGPDSHVCQHCSAIFPNLESLSRHLTASHGETSLVVSSDPCTCLMKDEEGVIDQGVEEKPFVCKVCREAFCTAEELAHHKKIHVGSKRFVCTMCRKSFKSRRDLLRHKRSHTGDKPFVCNVCKKGFSDSAHLKTHSMIHTGEKPHMCEICSESFIQKCALQIHMSKHTGEKPFVCNICNRGFSNSAHLKTHKMIHTGEKPHMCEMCGESFIQKCALQRHMRKHTGDKPFVCSICNKAFICASSLGNHKKTHVHKSQSNRVQKMHVDDQQASSASAKSDSQCSAVSKNDAESVHTQGGSSFVGVTGTGIAGQRALDLGDEAESLLQPVDDVRRNSVVHVSSDSSSTHSSRDENSQISEQRAVLQTSTGHSTTSSESADKPFACLYCSRGFVELNNLRVHINSSHKDKLPPDCVKPSTSQENSRKKNAQKAKKNEFLCSMCGSKSAELCTCSAERTSAPDEDEDQESDIDSQDQEDSLNSFPWNHHSGDIRCFVCDLCGKKFKSRRNLVRHQWTHREEKPFVCNICKKGFTCTTHLKTHSMVHTREKPHECDFCGRTFGQKCSLQKHMITHTGKKSSSCNICGEMFPSEYYMRKHKMTHPNRPTRQRRKSAAVADDSKSITDADNEISCSSVNSEAKGGYAGTPLEQSRCPLRKPTTVASNDCLDLDSDNDKSSSFAESESQGHDTTVQQPAEEGVDIVISDSDTVCSPVTSDGEDEQGEMVSPPVGGMKDPGLDESPEVSSQKVTITVVQTSIYTAGFSSSPEKPYACHYCRASFVQLDSLTLHMYADHTDKLLESSRFGGNQHRKADPGNQPSVPEAPTCTVCNKVFHRNADLRKHVKETDHTGFACDVCNTRFVSRQDMVRHKTLHAGGRQFVCHKKSSPAAQQHRNRYTQDTGERFCTCDTCGMTFLTVRSLREHKKTHLRQWRCSSESEPDLKQDQEADLEADVEADVEAELEPELEPDLERNQEADLEPDLEPEIGPDLEADPVELEEDQDADLEPDLEPDQEADEGSDTDAYSETNAGDTGQHDSHSQEGGTARKNSRAKQREVESLSPESTECPPSPFEDMVVPRPGDKILKRRVHKPRTSAGLVVGAAVNTKPSRQLAADRAGGRVQQQISKSSSEQAGDGPNVSDLDCLAGASPGGIEQELESAALQMTFNTTDSPSSESSPSMSEQVNLLLSTLDDADLSADSDDPTSAQTVFPWLSTSEADQISAACNETDALDKSVSENPPVVDQTVQVCKVTDALDKSVSENPPVVDQTSQVCKVTDALDKSVSENPPVVDQTVQVCKVTDALDKSVSENPPVVDQTVQVCKVTDALDKSVSENPPVVDQTSQVCKVTVGSGEARSEEPPVDQPQLSESCAEVGEQRVIKKKLDSRNCIICDVCGQTMKTSSYRRHKKIHTGHKPHLCGTCGKAFATTSQAHNHEKTHSEERPYLCKHCGKGFKTSATLRGHVRRHLNIKSFRCEVCGKGFVGRHELKTHMYYHIGSRPYVCGVCGKGFAWALCYKKHCLIHSELDDIRQDAARRRNMAGSYVEPFVYTGHRKDRARVTAESTERHVPNPDQSAVPKTSFNAPATDSSVNRPHLCPHCTVAFVEEESLRLHINFSHKDKLPPPSPDSQSNSREKGGGQSQKAKQPLLCRICHQTFSCTSDLRKHMPSHGGSRSKKWHCDLCEKSFTREAHLHRHKRFIHSGDKPFVCSVCSKDFASETTLNAHMRIHTGEKPYVCEICNRRFSHKGSFMSHKMTHTNERPFRCKICHMSFRRNSGLQRHSYTHTGDFPHKCSQCPKKFPQLSLLKQHERIHTGEKPFVCKVCDKAFHTQTILYIHVRIHSDTSPLVCDQCGKVFTAAYRLDLHKATHKGEELAENAS